MASFPPTAVYQFTREGVGVDFFGGTVAEEIYSSIASNGTDFFVGTLTGRIRQFSGDGTFLGYFGTQTMPNARLEFDSQGNLYATSVRTSIRFASDGTVSQAFSGLGGSYGIDADADGDVYVRGASMGVGVGIYKYDAAGTLIGFTPTPQAPNGGDMAIDEANQILYVSSPEFSSPDREFSVKAHDISGPTAYPATAARTYHMPANPTTGGGIDREAGARRCA